MSDYNFGKEWSLFLIRFFDARYISHTKRAYLCQKLREHFKYRKAIRRPSRDWLVGMAFGSLSATAVLTIVGRAVLL